MSIVETVGAVIGFPVILPLYKWAVSGEFRKSEIRDAGHLQDGQSRVFLQLWTGNIVFERGHQNWPRKFIEEIYTMLQTIRNGSRNVDVALLQALLNKKRAVPQLGVDGIFGRNTEAALRHYQTNNPTLRTDGVAGPLTWGTFFMIREIRHNTPLRAQTGTMGCWSAAAGMITNAPMSHGSRGASTGAGGGLSPSINNVQTFAAAFGWRLHNHQSAPPVSVIANAMARNPVWIGFEGQNFKHAVVFSKVLTDGTNAGTAFEVQDPWPVGRGTTYFTGYANGTVTLRSASHRPQAIVAFVVGP